MPEVTTYSIQSSTLQDIADAIREKKESEDPIAVSDFADEILSIPVTPPEPPAVITDLMLPYKPLLNNDNVLSSDVEDGQPYYVFNDNNSSCRLSNRRDRYFGYKFPSPVVCNRMVVRLPSGEGVWAYNRSPQEWYMQGSNDDGSTWTTFAHCTESWSDYETVLTKEKEFDNSTAYKWIRMYITSVPAGDPNINYIELQNKSSGGGGAVYPQATKTLIVDNTSLTNTLTFTDSYANYDFLEMVTYNSSSQKETSFLVTPSMVTASFTYSSNLMNFNEFDSDQYVCYKKTSDTVWTKNNSRNLNIKTIHGLTLSNATKTETVLYSREAISGSNVALTPPAGKTFYDYDYILFMTCTGSNDETQPCNSVFMNPVKDCMFDTFVSKIININKYNTYQSSTVEADSITSYRYFYVVGLNFEYA